jgi:hypothetical protein
MSLELPKGLISPEKAKELNQQFVKTRSNKLDKIVEKLDNKPKKKDALSSWFSIEELKNYIAYVESKAPDANGLRVYFGAYDKKSEETEKSNVSTVFFVPTRTAVGSSQKDGLEGGDNSDIDDLDGLNSGGLGNPPSAEYPQ